MPLPLHLALFEDGLMDSRVGCTHRRRRTARQSSHSLQKYNACEKFSQETFGLQVRIARCDREAYLLSHLLHAAEREPVGAGVPPHVDLALLILPDLEASLWTDLGVAQQVHHRLVVDLNK